MADYPTSVWDGESENRTVGQSKAPDYRDWARMIAELSATQTELDSVKTLGGFSAWAAASGKFLVGDGTNFVEVAMSGDAALDSTGKLTLATVDKTYAIALSNLRQEDDGQALLPASPDGDGGTLGLGAAAGSPVLGSSTNNTAATEYCMFDFVVPADYVVGEDLTVRIKGKLSAAANAESLLDVVCKHIKGGALDGTDLCSTAAIDMKAVIAEADEDFTISGVEVGDELAPGSVLNIAISFERDDTGGSTAGVAQINGIEVIVPSYR